MTEHGASARKVNIGAPGGVDRWRYRGRCLCGWQTAQHYATPDAARVAVNRVHIVTQPQRSNA